MSDLRITILCPHVRIAGGVRAILTYADRLARRGHDVEVRVPAKSALRAWWRTFSREGPAFMPGFAARIRWVARWRPGDLRDADVLLATAWRSAPVVAAAPPRSGEKFYLVQHYESLYHGSPEQVDATYRLPLRKIVISTWLRDVMREKFDADAEVLVTPVDPRLFHRVPAVAATGSVSAFDGGPPRVLMLHHDHAWKGVADGMEAVARVRGRGVDLALVGFGLKAPRRSVPYDEFHENLPQEMLARLYSGCQIYLCPSWDEGLGMPPMEAMACGAALVTYDNGGCRDYARDGETALVARRRDVDDLAANLERLVADAALRGRLADAGRELITRAFAWDAAVDRLERLFRMR